MRALRAIGLVSAAMAGACASLEPEAPGAGDAGGGEVTSVAQHLIGDTCPPNSCGDPNSPVIDGVYFWRMHLPKAPNLSGLANPEGFWISGIRRPGVGPMRLVLAGGDRLLGIDEDQELHEHLGLEGTEIEVSRVEDGELKQYVIWINSVAPSVPSGNDGPAEWFWVGTKRPIEAYDFHYYPVDDPGNRRPLCAKGRRDPNMVRAIVFGSDTYNPRTRDVTIGSMSSGWINIACVDSAIYKMHKIGYTSAAPPKTGTPVATADQRSALLKAWTSHVCDTDEVFTAQGELIMLRESLKVAGATGYHYPSALLDDPESYAATVEAIWGRDGAVCLSNHRREEADPEIYARIKTACGELPRCEDLPGHWSAHGLVITGSPP